VLRLTPSNGRKLGPTGNMCVWDYKGISVTYVLLDPQREVACSAWTLPHLKSPATAQELRTMVVLTCGNPHQQGTEPVELPLLQRRGRDPLRAGPNVAEDVAFGVAEHVVRLWTEHRVGPLGLADPGHDPGGEVRW
jgi:hypothetical protein